MKPPGYMPGWAWRKPRRFRGSWMTMQFQTLKDAFYAQGAVPDCPVIDMHAHMGPFYGISFPRPDVEGMLHAMDRAGVRWLVFCHHHALHSPDFGNPLNIEAVRRYPGR